MGSQFEQWVVLSGSDKPPEPGDLVNVFPVGDMTGYVLCGAVYVDGPEVPSGRVMDKSEPAVIVHMVLFNGEIMTISGHSHVVQVLVGTDED